MQQFIMLTAQLRPGDIVTESGLVADRRERDVLIRKIEFGEIWYARARGFVPVMFVSGVDTLSDNPVRYTVNGWRRWLVGREVQPTVVTEMLSV